MAKKKETEDSLTEIRKNTESKKLVYGTEQTIKNLKLGKVGKIFLSANCPEEVKKSIKYYAELSETPVSQLSIDNTELGTICKKPFSISVLGLLK